MGVFLVGNLPLGHDLHYLSGEKAESSNKNKNSKPNQIFKCTKKQLEKKGNRILGGQIRNLKIVKANGVNK
jgi:hypothetical protein